MCRATTRASWCARRRWRPARTCSAATRRRPSGQFTEAVVNLKFDEEPRYSAYVPLFEPLCGPGPQRPILLEEKTLRVGQKRGREAFEGEDMEIVSLLPMACPSCRLLCLVPCCAPGNCITDMCRGQEDHHAGTANSQRIAIFYCAPPYEAALPLQHGLFP